MIVTVVGPTQPYLAANVNVNIDTINLVWTFGFFGYTVGALITGAAMSYTFLDEIVILLCAFRICVQKVLHHKRT